MKKEGTTGNFLAKLQSVQSIVTGSFRPPPAFSAGQLLSSLAQTSCLALRFDTCTQADGRINHRFFYFCFSHV